jgi:hypothetical protein
VANSMRVLAGDFSIGKIANEEGEFQPALIVGIQVAYLMDDDSFTNFYNAAGEVVKNAPVIEIPKRGELMAIPKER